VSPRSGFSPQTLAVMAALSDRPSEWHHGYEIAKGTGLKSGTLYPILIRLSDRGLLEADWEEDPAPGRPRRHLYRLTATGLAAAALATAGEDVRLAHRSARREPPAWRPLRPAGEGS
jgi:DNA-binding PadR family transcriptional regulator